MLNIETILRHVYFSVLSPFYMPELLSGTERPGVILNMMSLNPGMNKYVFHSQALGGKPMNGK